MKTQALSTQVTGNDYFSCYRSRMEVNNSYFVQIATELTNLGFTVLHPKNGLISFIRVESESKQITFCFADVPYRWYLSADIDYRNGNGSSITLKTSFDYDKPFTANEIIEQMKDKVKTIGNNSHLSIFNNQ